MQFTGIYIKQLNTGGYKAVIWGHASGYISNYRGTAYRTMIPKGQPKQGFSTVEEAEQYVRITFPNKTKAIEYASINGDGSFMPDNMPGYVVHFDW